MKLKEANTKSKLQVEDYLNFRAPSHMEFMSQQYITKLVYSLIIPIVENGMMYVCM